MNIIQGDIFYIVLSVSNIVLCAIIAATQIKYYLAHRKKYWIWIKIMMGVIGIYWSVLYIWITLQRIHIMPDYDPSAFGRTFVLPALTFTFGILAAGGLIRYRNGDCD